MTVDLGNLSSGAAGALLVALLTVVYTEIREARGGVRETAGLARLLFDEIERNEEAVHVGPSPAEPAQEFRELLLAQNTKVPAVDVWLETRLRLAQGLEPEDFETVVDYYQILHGLAMDLEQSKDPYGATAARPIPREAPSWQERTEDVKKCLRRYASPGWRKEHLGF